MFLSRSSHSAKLAMVLSVLLLGSGAAGAGARHLHLTKSFPAADQILQQPPDTVRLWFSEEPELALAAVGLEGPGGKVDMGKPEPTSDPKSFKAMLIGQLEAGSYRITWRAAGADGHAIRGRYDFELRVDASR